MSTQKALTELDFDEMLKTSFKKLAKKDTDFQAVIRDCQVSSSLSTLSVRNAVMACVSSDETVLSKIREFLLLSKTNHLISPLQKTNWRLSYQTNC
jgi:hypothetical protein